MSFLRFKFINHRNISIRPYSPFIKSPTSALELTKSASERLKALRQKFPNKALRIAVEAGGCHGFQYKFSLIHVGEEEINPQEDL